MALIKSALALTAGFLAFNAPAAESYIPALYNFSVMYDFNPVRGPVKTLSADVHSETDNYTVKVALSPQGCIETFSRTDSNEYGNAVLARQGNTLAGSLNNSPVKYVFDEKCNIVSMTDNYGMKTFQTNSAGLIERTMANGQPLSVYHYTDSGSFAGSQYFLNGKVASYSEVAYRDEKNKPLDFSMTTVFGEEYTLVGDGACIYDARKVPVECTITTKKIHNNNVVEEQHYSAKMAVTYY
ncbi:YnfC family lipoprotein [Cronobacter muytjensii]|nr:YnfC family lipoprotein [Cronobacter muytjensii]ELY6225057.1 YnfC family lipoprotein [Cronobacter muytjensii]